MFILRHRMRKSICVSGGGAESKTPKQALHCQQRARRGARSHELWGHDLSWNWELDAYLTEPPRHPGNQRILFFFLSLFIYFGRERKWGRDRERFSSRLGTVSAEPVMGLEPRAMRSWPEPKPRVSRSTNWDTQATLRYWYYFLCI